MTSKPGLQRPNATIRLLVIAGLCAGGFALPPLGKAQSDYENYTFTTLAGPAESPGTHDGLAQAARFSNPFHGAIGRLGDLYISDRLNHTVRKISPGGMVTTLAGLAGQSGTADGTGSAARFNRPCGVVEDSAGNVYVADFASHTIRKVSPAGVVTTVAGSAGLYGAVDGAGAAARFDFPTGLAVDSADNVYVADQGNSTIRKLAPDGMVTTLAGAAGISGTNDGTGTAAKFTFPFGVAVDGSGNVYVADTGTNTIRKITPAGVVTTLAGLAGTSGSANGTGNKARFLSPFGLAVDQTGKLCVADTYNHIIRVITPAGVVTTLAGTAGEGRAADGTGTNARFHYPTGVAFDGAGNILVMDFSNNSIRKCTAAGVVTTFAGAGGLGVADGSGAAARFNYLADVAVDSSGNAYVADYSNHTIRKITPLGVVSTLAGKAGVSGSANGNGSSARFNGPVSVAVDGSANVYVADLENQTIRRITPSGAVTTIAGSAGISGTNDGIGNKARFFSPLGLAADTAGNVYVSDTWNHTIRKVTQAGVVTTLAGKAGTSGSADGTGTSANFFYPAGLEVDSAGNLFVADGGNQTIRKITAAGEVTTLAGTAGSTGSADGMGAAARFSSPFGLAMNNAGDIFVGEKDNFLIRKVTAAGKVTTLAGLAGVSGADDGTGPLARFGCPEGLAVGSDGTLLVADACNHALRRGSASAPDEPIVDFPVERPGVIRQLEVTNLTTTAWTWRVVRYPSSSSAQLSSTSVRNPTFTPDMVDLYRIRFEGTDTSGRQAIRTLDITGAELTQPRFDAVGASAGSAVLAGSGGLPGGTFALLSTTNVSLPIDQWSSMTGNRFDAQGNFAITNEVSLPERYYMIRVP